MAERQALVIGLGNLSRRDDGLGWHAINSLRERLKMPLLSEFDDGQDDLGQAVDTIFVPQLAPELAELAAIYKLLFLVDARVGGEAGLKAEMVSDTTMSTQLLSHELNPANFLTLAGKLYGHAPKTYVLSVRGEDFSYGEGLSPDVQAVLPELTEKIVSLLL